MIARITMATLQYGSLALQNRKFVILGTIWLLAALVVWRSLHYGFIYWMVPDLAFANDVSTFGLCMRTVLGLALTAIALSTALIVSKVVARF